MKKKTNQLKKMKIVKLFVVIAAAACILPSCRTVNQTSRAALDIPGLTFERSDYKLTSDIEASAQVKLILGGLIVKGVDKKNIKIGQLNGRNMGSTDESMAVYNLIKKNPDVDYLTNIRYFKTYDKKLFSKTLKTKIVAKGIIIKTDK